MACFLNAFARLRQWYLDLCGLPDEKAAGGKQGSPQEAAEQEMEERPFVSPPVSDGWLAVKFQPSLI